MKQNKVEKLLTGVLSISLAMGVSVMPAFAAQVQGPPYEDMSRVYLTKNYELANTGTISPEETFTFTIDPGFWRVRCPPQGGALKPQIICRLSAT